MKGFTLLETLIATGVAMAVGTFLVTFLASNTGLFYQERSLVNSGLALNDVLQVVSSDIRQASGIPEGYPESSPVYVSGLDILVIKLPSTSTSGVIPGVFDYIVISKDVNQPAILTKQIFADPQSNRVSTTQLLTPLLDKVVFSYLDKNGNPVAPTLAVQVKLSLDVLSKTGQIGTKKSSTAITNLRNMP